MKLHEQIIIALSMYDYFFLHNCFSYSANLMNSPHSSSSVQQEIPYNFEQLLCPKLSGLPVQFISNFLKALPGLKQTKKSAEAVKLKSLLKNDEKFYSINIKNHQMQEMRVYMLNSQQYISYEVTSSDRRCQSQAQHKKKRRKRSSSHHSKPPSNMLASSKSLRDQQFVREIIMDLEVFTDDFTFEELKQSNA